MGKAIVLAFLILLATGAVLWAVFVAGRAVEANQLRKQGFAGRAGVTGIQRAAAIFRQLGTNTSPLMNDIEVINDTNRKNITNWLNTYDKNGRS